MARGGQKPETRGAGTGTAFRILVLAAIVATFAQIVMGGVVRVTGSGLGCPDWPLCHGRIIPPLQGPVLIEYSHRLLASLVSVLVIAVAALAVVRYRRRREVLAPALLAAALLVALVILGGVTVLLELPPTVVTAHLGVALALLGVLIAIAIFPGTATRVSTDARRLAGFRWLALSALVAVYLLLLSGAYVRGAGAALACGATWPLCGGALLPSGELPLLHMAHRFLAAAVSLYLLFVAWRAPGLARPTLTRTAWLLAALFLAQVFIGAANPWSHGAPWAQASHLALGTAIWGSTVALAAFAWRATSSPLEQPPPGAHGPGS